MIKKNLLLSALCLLIISIGHSQSAADYPKDDAFLNGNDIVVYFNSGGDMSWDLAGNPGFEVPKSSGKNTIFAGNLWLGGFDQGGTLHTAAQTYRQSGIDIWPGPKADLYDSTYNQRYGHVWKVRADEIVVHQALFNNPGYLAPQDILTWPGNGDTLNGEPWHLAPFVDVNQNDVYEPIQGDFPAIQGQQTLYMISSDDHYWNSETASDQLGVDIHTMAYVYDEDPGSPIDQTLFVSYRIVNRSVNSYQLMRIGQWIDFDLGYAFDDYVGCDTAREAFFVYNADSLDQSAIGYGLTPPAQGVTFLNAEMNGFSTYLNDFSSFGNPEDKNDYYGYLRNVWKSGNPFTIGGAGNVGTTPTNYLFSGDPRDTAQWSMKTTSPIYSDVRGIGTIGPFTFSPGESVCLDMAYVFARADSGNHLSSVGKLYENLDAVRAFADSSLIECPLLQTQVISTGILIPDEYKPEITMFPNPVSTVLHVESKEGPCQVSVTDLFGRTVYLSGSESDSHTISSVEWPQGMYLVTVDIEGITYTSQVLVN